MFTFATRLTRLTPYLAAATPETMLARAAQAAPDWAGGTRIGAALRDFNDRYGARGMARGAVVLIISDGWETGDPALVGAQMARLHRIAYRIVWANPRTQSDRYRPEVGGMAAAWPYCDAVVSAHNFESLDELLAALRAPRVHRPSFARAQGGRCDRGWWCWWCWCWCWCCWWCPCCGGDQSGRGADHPAAAAVPADHPAPRTSLRRIAQNIYYCVSFRSYSAPNGTRCLKDTR